MSDMRIRPADRTQLMQRLVDQGLLPDPTRVGVREVAATQWLRVSRPNPLIHLSPTTPYVNPGNGGPSAGIWEFANAGTYTLDKWNCNFGQLTGSPAILISSNGVLLISYGGLKPETLYTATIIAYLPGPLTISATNAVILTVSPNGGGTQNPGDDEPKFTFEVALTSDVSGFACIRLDASQDGAWWYQTDLAPS